MGLALLLCAPRKAKKRRFVDFDRPILSGNRYSESVPDVLYNHEVTSSQLDFLAMLFIVYKQT